MGEEVLVLKNSEEGIDSLLEKAAASASYPEVGGGKNQTVLVMGENVAEAGSVENAGDGRELTSSEVEAASGPGIELFTGERLAGGVGEGGDERLAEALRS